MNKNDFKSSLTGLGVKRGMNLMVHSSLRRIGFNGKGGAEMVMELLFELIGPECTLIMPTITGKVTREQPVFHAEYSPSDVGHLTNVFRKSPGALRSFHPVHSVAAKGPMAEFFTVGHHMANTPWSPDTPYGKILRDKECSILFLGVDLTYNSCFHALEIEARIPGMHTTEEARLYAIEEKGVVHEVMHHWHDSRTRRYFTDMEHILLNMGCLSCGRTGLGISRLVQAVPMREVILRILGEEPWLMIRPSPENSFVWEP